jgi:hypothetical protein
LLGFTLTYFHEFWWSCDLQGLNRKTAELARHTTPKTCPNQLLPKSNLEVLQRKNQSTTLRRAHPDDRNGYIICHIRCPESEDIRRREGFGKTGITPLWCELILFGNGTTTRMHPPKIGLNLHSGRPTGLLTGPISLAQLPNGPRFWYVPVCSRRFLHQPIKPHIGHRSRSVGSYGGEEPPQDYINRPQTP